MRNKILLAGAYIVFGAISWWLSMMENTFLSIFGWFVIAFAGLGLAGLLRSDAVQDADGTRMVDRLDGDRQFLQHYFSSQK